MNTCNSKTFDTIIFETKEKIIRAINANIERVTIPELDYVELPHRIRLSDNFGEDLDDCIIAVRKNEVILNTMFNESTPKLITLNVEMLNSILKQIEQYTY